jgi:hypothetical protein
VTPQEIANALAASVMRHVGEVPGIDWLVKTATSDGWAHATLSAKPAGYMGPEVRAAVMATIAPDDTGDIGALIEKRSADAARDMRRYLTEGLVQ